MPNKHSIELFQCWLHSFHGYNCDGGLAKCNYLGGEICPRYTSEKLYTLTLALLTILLYTRVPPTQGEIKIGNELELDHSVILMWNVHVRTKINSQCVACYLLRIVCVFTFFAATAYSYVI